MAGKIPVVFKKVIIKKTFNAKATKAAPANIIAALTTAIGKSGKLKVVQKIGEKDKGFSVEPVVLELTCDEKKSIMSVKMQASLWKLPKPFFLAKATGTASISGLNFKKIEGDVKALLSAVCAKMGKDARKALEGKISAL